MIYLASPYSDPDPAVREKRYKLAKFYQDIYRQAGHKIISPIVMFHELAEKFKIPYDADAWERPDMELLKNADEMWVLRIDGYIQSKGIGKEIDFCLEVGKPFIHIGVDYESNLSTLR